MKKIEVKFPLVEDISMNVAKLYGMIQPAKLHIGCQGGILHRSQKYCPRHNVLSTVIGKKL